MISQNYRTIEVLSPIKPVQKTLLPVLEMSFCSVGGGVQVLIWHQIYSRWFPKRGTDKMNCNYIFSMIPREWHFFLPQLLAPEFLLAGRIDMLMRFDGSTTLFGRSLDRGDLSVSHECQYRPHMYYCMCQLQVPRQQGEALVSPRLTMAMLGAPLHAVRSNTGSDRACWGCHWEIHDVSTQ